MKERDDTIVVVSRADACESAACVRNNVIMNEGPARGDNVEDQTRAADLRYPRKIESRTSVMMLCIALVSCKIVNISAKVVRRSSWHIQQRW